MPNMASTGTTFQKRSRHDRDRRRTAPADEEFDERWGDQDVSEEEAEQEESEQEFPDSSAKRRKLSNGHATASSRRSPSPPPKPKETADEQDRRERDEFARRLADREKDKASAKKNITESRDATCRAAATGR